MASMLANGLRRTIGSAIKGKQPIVVGLNNYFTYANEITHPLNRKPPVVSAAEAVQCIKSGK